jgi:regulatory protein
VRLAPCGPFLVRGSTCARVFERRRRTGRQPRTLKARAIALLARREYARAELAARLAATGAPRDEVDSLLDELQQLGLLSDARFAGALVRQKTSSHAQRAIARELRERGVAKEVAAAALAESGAVDELAAAQALWQRRFGRPPADEREKARQIRFLLSRGYPPAVAFRVLRSAGARIEDD